MTHPWFPKKRKPRGVRNAPLGALTRSEFARQAGVGRETLRRWEQRKLFRPQYALSSTKWQPYYLPDDLKVFAEKRWWRSGAATRIVRNALRRRTR
jgi:DNA-binding transcriptional MerR regulator